MWFQHFELIWMYNICAHLIFGRVVIWFYDVNHHTCLVQNWIIIVEYFVFRSFECMRTGNGSIYGMLMCPIDNIHIERSEYGFKKILHVFMWLKIKILILRLMRIRGFQRVQIWIYSRSVFASIGPIPTRSRSCEQNSRPDPKIQKIINVCVMYVCCSCSCTEATILIIHFKFLESITECFLQKRFSSKTFEMDNISLK